MNKSKLSPFDQDMCLMIANITKAKVFFNESEENAKIEVCVFSIKPDHLEALKNAIVGRLSERLISINVENRILEITFKYDPEYKDAPDEQRFDLLEPKPTAGKVYCRKLKEVNAVIFTPENIDEVIAFTGGGTLTTKADVWTRSFYEFPTQNGLLLQVYAGEYIVEENGVFSKMTKQEFEKDFELKY